MGGGNGTAVVEPRTTKITHLSPGVVISVDHREEVVVTNPVEERRGPEVLSHIVYTARRMTPTSTIRTAYRALHNVVGEVYQFTEIGRDYNHQNQGAGNGMDWRIDNNLLDGVGK